MHFETLEIDKYIKKGLLFNGFFKPSLVQKNVLGTILKRKNILIQAKSGSGKTLAFTIGILNTVNPKLSVLQGLVVSPNRELAIQTGGCLTAVGRFLMLKISIATGGAKYNRHDFFGSQIISGTPGKILLLLKNKHINFSSLSVFVLDEVDQLLDLNFQNQVLEIYNHIPNKPQMILVSATFNSTTKSFANKIAENSIKSFSKRWELHPETITHKCIFSDSTENALKVIYKLYDRYVISNAIIFCNSKKNAKFVYKKLNEQLFPSSLFTGEIFQKERDKLLADFKNGNIRILVTTDCLSRGLDIEDVSMVINFDPPPDQRTYLHRVGRTGRFDKNGTAITILNTENPSIWEKKYNVHFSELTFI